MTASESFNVCDSCGCVATVEWENIDHPGTKMYYSCETCWYHVQDSADELRQACEHCGASDELACVEDPVECADCKVNVATETFNHLDGRSFQLCSGCFGMADHEDDYGAEFGSAPRLRVKGKATLCQCPLPCNDDVSTRCALCRGIVVCRQDS